MRLKRFHRIGWAVAFVAVLVSLGVGVAAATGSLSPGPANTYTGCVNNTDGNLRIVSADSPCRSNESVITLSGPQPQGPQTVSVDCTAGQSIQQAINNSQINLPLRIDVNGVCNESVNIQRDEVSVFGNLGAGITAPSGQDAVDVSATHVNLNNLTLMGGNNAISAFTGAAVSATNMQISGVQTGVHVGDEAMINLTNSTITGVVQQGVSVGVGGTAQVDNDTISNSGQDGITDGGRLDVNNTTITNTGGNVMTGGATGILILGTGSAGVNGVTVEHSSTFGISLYGGGHLELNNSTISYSGSAGNGTGIESNGGTVDISNTQVTNNAGWGISMNESRFYMKGSTIENNSSQGIFLSAGSDLTMGNGPANIVSNNDNDGIHIGSASDVVFTGSNGPTNADQIINNNGWGVSCGSGPDQGVEQNTPGTVSGNSSGQDNCLQAAF